MIFTNHEVYTNKICSCMHMFSIHHFLCMAYSNAYPYISAYDWEMMKGILCSAFVYMRFGHTIYDEWLSKTSQHAKHVHLYIKEKKRKMHVIELGALINYIWQNVMGLLACTVYTYKNARKCRLVLCLIMHHHGRCTNFVLEM